MRASSVPGILRGATLLPASLLLLAQRMPHLTSLQCGLRTDEHASNACFPPRLRSLSVDLGAPGDPESPDVSPGEDLYEGDEVQWNECPLLTARGINAALCGIADVQSLTRLEVSLCAPEPVDAQTMWGAVSLAPLARLRQLHSLALDLHEDEDGFAALAGGFSFLREMGWLRELDISHFPREALAALLASPCPFTQLCRLSVPDGCDVAHLSLLSSLPQLTALEDKRCPCASFDWLAPLTLLADINIRLWKEWSPVVPVERAHALLRALPLCRSLTRLSLCNLGGVVDAQLGQALFGLPRLRAFTLGFTPLGGLAFLTQPPITAQLESLTLFNFLGDLSPDELRHVESLCALRELTIIDCAFIPLLTAEQRARLTPPALHMPQLQRSLLAPEWPDSDA